MKALVLMLGIFTAVSSYASTSVIADDDQTAPAGDVGAMFSMDMGGGNCKVLPAPSGDGPNCHINCCTGPRAPGPTCVEMCTF